jgi:hypothetical protein
MAIKKAVNKDDSADRPSRPTPTHRDGVAYQTVEAHGVTNPGTTVDQTVRSHEEAKDPAAKAAGAIDCYEPGLANAKRREAHVMAKRAETAAIFDSHRKSAPGYPYAKNSKFKKS